MQVICKHYTVSHKELEHLQIWVCGEGPRTNGTNSPQILREDCTIRGKDSIVDRVFPTIKNVLGELS